MTAPPLQPGQRIELAITDIAFGGDGIGRVDGFVVFVPFVVEGERIEAEIVDVKRRYATADLVRVLAPSPARVEPRCPYYARCAGCQYQHIDYPRQLDLKRKQIRDIFQRIGGIPDPPIEPVVGSPRPYHYRNKIVLHGPGPPGFWTVRGRSILAIEQCPIAREEINARLAEISNLKFEISNHLAIRSNSEGRIWTYEETRGGRASPRLADAGVPPAPGEPAPAESAARPPSSIPETVLGRTFQVPVGSFFQVNAEVIARVLEHLRSVFDAAGCRILVDAYCGVGLFALSLADRAGHVYGIEIDRAAIDAANQNAEHLGVKNHDFYPGATERLLFYTLRQCAPQPRDRGNLDEVCLVLDPPRSGCGKAVLKTLRDLKPRQIVYISCAPPMLARDVKELIRAGYRLKRVTPFDMFPQTQHCEAVAELEAADLRG